VWIASTVTPGEKSLVILVAFFVFFPGIHIEPIIAMKLIIWHALLITISGYLVLIKEMITSMEKGRLLLL